MRPSKISLSAPISTEILLTRKCNLKCKHCIFDCGPDKEERLSKEQIKKIINELARMKVFTVGLNGGEPLLLKEELYEIIKYICKKNLNFVLTTNGTLLDKKFIKFIARKNILCIRISLDFPKEKEHNLFRGGKKAFQKTVNNIKKCVKNGIQTVLLVSLSKENIAKFNEIIKLAKKLNITSINFFPIISFGRAQNIKKMILNKQEYKTFLEFFNKKQKEIKKPKLLGDFPLEVLTNKELKKEAKNVIGRVCPAGVLTCVISWNGDVYPCPLFPVRVGNIFEKSLEEIWKNSPLLKEIRNPQRFTGKCKTCKHLNICRGGCIARTYVKTKDLSNPDPFCWYNENK